MQMNVAMVLRGFAARKWESYSAAMSTLENREAGKCMCSRTHFTLRVMHVNLRDLLKEFIFITMGGFIHISPVVTSVTVLFVVIKT
jgi:hypothetical protein